jgi:hypothetical protein
MGRAGSGRWRLSCCARIRRRLLDRVDYGHVEDLMVGRVVALVRR